MMIYKFFEQRYAGALFPWESLNHQNNVNVRKKELKLEKGESKTSMYSV